MKIFIKYKTDGYKKEHKFLDMDKMYFWNGNTYFGVINYEVLSNCITNNWPIVVLNKSTGSLPSMAELAFIINPSTIAMVFPLNDRVWEVAEDDNAV